MRKVLVASAVAIAMLQLILISHTASGNTLIDSFNMKFLGTKPSFSAPAYEIGLEGRPHAYDTDYGLNVVAEEFSKIGLVSRNAKITFAEAKQFTRPLQCLLRERDADFTSEIVYDDIITKPSQIEADLETCTFKFLEPPPVDFIFFIPGSGCKFDRIDDFMVLVKVIGSGGREVQVFQNRKSAASS